MGVSDEYRKNLEANIVEGIAYGIENKTLTQEELPDIAKFVLDKIDEIRTTDQLHSFLNELSNKWPALQHVELVAKRDFQQQEDLEAAEKVSSLLHADNLDDALKVAKAANGE